MLDRSHPTFVMLAPIVRDRHGRITAFRLGYIAGEQLTRPPPPCPYDDRRGRRGYLIGVRAGRRQERYRRRRAEWEAEAYAAENRGRAMRAMALYARDRGKE